jgi:hypothetical protein
MGAISGINYLDAYRKYYGFLYTGALRKTTYILDLFRDWNETFFKDRVGTDTAAADEDYMETMRALEAAPCEQDSSAEEQQAGSDAPERDSLEREYMQSTPDTAQQPVQDPEVETAMGIDHGPDTISRLSSPWTEDEDAATRHVKVTTSRARKPSTPPPPPPPRIPTPEATQRETRGRRKGKRGAGRQ